MSFSYSFIGTIQKTARVVIDSPVLRNAEGIRLDLLDYNASLLLHPTVTPTAITVTLPQELLDVLGIDITSPQKTPMRASEAPIPIAARRNVVLPHEGAIAFFSAVHANNAVVRIPNEFSRGMAFDNWPDVVEVTVVLESRDATFVAQVVDRGRAYTQRLFQLPRDISVELPRGIEFLWQLMPSTAEPPAARRVEAHGHASGGTVSYYYRAWQSIKWRCLDPKNAAYKWYGARGITVDPRWAGSFQTFHDDIVNAIGERPEGYSLDRIDVNGNYVASNLRWASSTVQARNLTTTRYYTIDGVSKTLPEWADQYGIDLALVRQRVQKFNWALEKALTVPARAAGPHPVDDKTKPHRQRLRQVWHEMKRRCEDPEAPAYADYGGRGIKVCDRWQDFDNFFADITKMYTPDVWAAPWKYSHDRIDTNGDYSPDNIRLVTAKEQIRNRRNTKTLILFNETRPLAEWVELAQADGVNTTYERVRHRIRKGWTPLEALGTPTAPGRTPNEVRIPWRPSWLKP